jgi:hypothetical protein
VVAAERSTLNAPLEHATGIPAFWQNGGFRF